MTDEPTEEPRIEPRETGPYVVIGAKSIKGSDGVMLEDKPKRVLCRCGKSANKPFCDGSHKRIGFDPAEEIKPSGGDRLIAYEGKEITVFFNPRVCAHSGECSRIAGHVFNGSLKPWVQPDLGTVEEVKAVIAGCPSGALTMKGPDGEPEHLLAVRDAEITIQKDGPIWVQGIPVAAEPKGLGMTRAKFALCRCGLSGNKPFCDGSHKEKGWTEAEVAPPAE